MAERLTTAQRRFLEAVRDGKVQRVNRMWASYGGAASCAGMARKMCDAGLVVPPDPLTPTICWTLTSAGQEALDG